MGTVNTTEPELHNSAQTKLAVIITNYEYVAVQVLIDFCCTNTSEITNGH